jgi:hypothetical protein
MVFEPDAVPVPATVIVPLHEPVAKPLVFTETVRGVPVPSALVVPVVGDTESQLPAPQPELLAVALKGRAAEPPVTWIVCEEGAEVPAW